MIDRSTRETPSGTVTPNAVMESIDSDDFLAGVIRAEFTIAVRQRWDSGRTAARQGYAITVRDSGVRVQ